MQLPDPTVDGIWFRPVASLRLGRKNHVSYSRMCVSYWGNPLPSESSSEKKPLVLKWRLILRWCSFPKGLMFRFHVRFHFLSAAGIIVTYQMWQMCHSMQHFFMRYWAMAILESCLFLLQLKGSAYLYLFVMWHQCDIVWLFLLTSRIRFFRAKIAVWFPEVFVHSSILFCFATVSFGCTLVCFGCFSTVNELLIVDGCCWLGVLWFLALPFDYWMSFRLTAWDLKLEIPLKQLKELTFFDELPYMLLEMCMYNVYILCIQIYLYTHLIMFGIYRVASLNTIYSISIFKWFIQCLHVTPEFCFSIFQQLFLLHDLSVGVCNHCDPGIIIFDIHGATQPPYRLPIRYDTKVSGFLWIDWYFQKTIYHKSQSDSFIALVIPWFFWTNIIPSLATWGFEHLIS